MTTRTEPAPIPESIPIPIPHRIQRWRNTALALACTGALTITGLASLQGTAYAAKGKTCAATYKLKGDASTSLPWDEGITQRGADDWDSYGYDAPRQALDGLTLPDDPVKQKEILDTITKPYGRYPANSRERVLAQYRDYLNKNADNPKPLFHTFADWLRGGWIRPNNNNRRGNAFEKKAVEDLGLLGPDWLCQEDVPILDENGNPVMVKGKPLVRRFDAVNYKTKEFVEFKAGPDRDSTQDFANEKFLEDPQRSDARMIYVNGEQKSRATTRYLDRLAAKPGNADRVLSYEHISEGEPLYEPGPYTAADPNLNTGEVPGGAASQVIEGSEETPQEMAHQEQLISEEDPEGMGVRGPGGVDFSTLQLSYVGKPVRGRALNYAYSANMVDESAGLGYGGKEKARLISDSFFTWLALTPDKFWVNLNPDQPDKVMDHTFGKTDAGRVLLQADLQMKHDFAKDLDPRQGIGLQLVDAIRRAGLPCGSVERNWIVPKPAQVRADSNGLYILAAPLQVNSVAATVKTPTPNSCALSAAQRLTYQTLVRTLVVPDIEKKINTAPQYADLRRVYSARVAAEYVREQDQQQATQYRSIINSDNVAKWPLRGANSTWTPRQTWKEYYKSFTQGDFSFACGQKVCVLGGVDFSKAPKRNVSSTQFKVEHKNLPRSTKTSARTMTSSADNHQLLLLGGGVKPSGGGGSGGGGGGGSTPTPTPTSTGKPTAPASHTPSPGHSSPAPGKSVPSTPPEKSGGGGGGLASTGTEALALAGIAAALLAAGAALVRWRRRRTSG
ncbi:LPXTG cell wall anchor domain-containing protein [Streptomyces sp. NPDC046862]|uniref:LPXTG cell wall anchor domain-containing protein n=1 Tax=Streptomyces sp. NPDC046862 TaxID=3154603 RepID=UPI003451C31A